MRIRSLLAVGVLAPAICSAIALVPAAHASAATYHSGYNATFNCAYGVLHLTSVLGEECGAISAGTYTNVLIVVQEFGVGEPGGAYVCETAAVWGAAVAGSYCTPV
jgi:hypothetical protein